VQRIYHQPDSDGNLKILEPLPAKLPTVVMELSLVKRLPKANRGAHDLARDGVFFAIDCHLCDFEHFLHDTFDLRRVNFLAADVDDLRLTPEDRKEWRFFYRAERLLLGNVSLRRLTNMFDRLKEI
jgi:hypothetical protein